MNGLSRVSLVALLTVPACVPTAIETSRITPDMTVRDGVSQVCVIRPGIANAPRTTEVMRDDGRVVGSIQGSGFFCYEVAPGPHRVTAEEAPATTEGASPAPQRVAAVEVSLVAGRRVFLRTSSGADRIALDLMPEPEARAAIADLRFASLTAPPGQAPVVVVAPPPGATAAAPPPPQRRGDGVAYGAAVGIGGGISRPGTATRPSDQLAALASIWVGVSAIDLFLIGVRIDAGVVGEGIGDLALDVACFPGARGSGPVRDFKLFGEVGIGGPLVVNNGVSFGQNGVAAVGRAGFAWERWQVSGVPIGPFLEVQTAHGGGLDQTAVLAGVGVSVFATPR